MKLLSNDKSDNVNENDYEKNDEDKNIIYPFKELEGKAECQEGNESMICFISKYIFVGSVLSIYKILVWSCELISNTFKYLNIL